MEEAVAHCAREAALARPASDLQHAASGAAGLLCRRAADGRHLLNSGGNLVWLDFSTWLIFAGLVSGVVAALVLLIDFIRDPGTRNGAGWAHVRAILAALLVELVNMFIHSRDGWTAVAGAGLVLTIVGALLILIAGWLHRSVAGHRAVIRRGAICVAMPRARRVRPFAEPRSIAAAWSRSGASRTRRSDPDDRHQPGETGCVEEQRSADGAARIQNSGDGHRADEPARGLSAGQRRRPGRAGAQGGQGADRAGQDPFFDFIFGMAHSSGAPSGPSNRIASSCAMPTATEMPSSRAFCSTILTRRLESPWSATTSMSRKPTRSCAIRLRRARRRSRRRGSR